MKENVNAMTSLKRKRIINSGKVKYQQEISEKETKLEIK